MTEPPEPPPPLLLVGVLLSELPHATIAHAVETRSAVSLNRRR